MGLKLLNLLLLTIIFSLFYGIIMGHNGWVYYQNMNSLIVQQTQENEKLRQENDYLQQRVNALKEKNPIVIESFVRRQLQYIRNDEIFFRIIDDRRLPKFYDKAAAEKYIPKPKVKAAPAKRN